MNYGTGAVMGVPAEDQRDWVAINAAHKQCAQLLAIADETLAKTQLYEVHGAGVEAFGSVEFKNRIGAQHIERADFRHHVGGNVAHNPVEPILRLQRLLHELAQPFQ